MTPKTTTRAGLLWVGLAALIGFLVPAVFSLGLRWERAVFLVPYVLIVGGFLAAFFRRHPVGWRQLVGKWPYAVAGIAVASFLLLRNIQGQPESAVPEGAQLALALFWVGLAYGVLDGVFLNVMPVLAVRGGAFFEAVPLREKLVRGLAGLAASLVVTAAYHLGYAEFQGAALAGVLIGNTIIAASYLLTGSPLAAIITHAVIHVAAVLHGMETTLQLPPHYAS